MSDRPQAQARLSADQQEIDGIKRFVADLEAALNRHDAAEFNRYFTDDVVWGNPNGSVVQGREPLSAVHKTFL